jgi:hypothetical protein
MRLRLIDTWAGTDVRDVRDRLRSGAPAVESRLWTVVLSISLAGAATPSAVRAQSPAWESLGGAILEQPSCVGWGPNRIDCFARGTDAAMFHGRWP